MIVHWQQGRGILGVYLVRRDSEQIHPIALPKRGIASFMQKPLCDSNCTAPLLKLHFHLNPLQWRCRARVCHGYPGISSGRQRLLLGRNPSLAQILVQDASFDLLNASSKTFWRELEEVWTLLNLFICCQMSEADCIPVAVLESTALRAPARRCLALFTVPTAWKGVF